MSTFHVVTPHIRYDNRPRLLEMLGRQNVQWHLLVDPGVTIPDLPDWVHVHSFRPAPWGFFTGHWLYNMFLDEVGVNDDDYYNLITDDDFFEDGVFDKLRPFTEPILVTSMVRGKWGTLWAEPGSVRIGSMGLEQVHIKGSVLRPWRLDGFYEADGLLIERLWATHPNYFRFVPDAKCLFNYLPPGNAALWSDT